MTCPNCGSTNVTEQPLQPQPNQTKCTCNDCGKEWYQ